MKHRCKDLSASVLGPRLRTLLSGLVVTLALKPHLLLACAACHDDLSKVAGVASFFVYLGKKSATVAAASAAAPSVEPTDRA